MFYKTGIPRLQPSLTGVAFISFALVILICMFPEIGFAAELSLENQMDKVGTLANNKLKVIGISIAAIFSGAAALIKGNFNLMLIVVAIASILGLLLEWVGAGMRFAI